MLTARRACLALIAGSVLSFAGISTSLAAPAHSAMQTLVVKISPPNGSGTWGSVTVDYKSGGMTHMLGRCKAVKCTYHVPEMAKVILKEKPSNPSTWPFKDWKLTDGGKTKTYMGAKLKFEIMGKKATANAVYKLA